MPARFTRLSPSAVRTQLADALAELRRSLELPEQFPAEVVAEAEAVVASGAAVDGSDAGRADLREIEFHTIDPEGSRDLDQALSISREGSGFVVHYAIADLAAFVRPGGAIDAETRRRGQTIYAPDGSVPLHPEVLSHGAASLLPEQDRRAYVWRFVLDEHGAQHEPPASPVRAWVRSRRQWSYVDAQEAIDTGDAPDALALLAAVGPLLIAQEAARGGASLKSPEEEIVATPEGYDLRARVTLPIEDWNAQISLMTGMAAAAIMLERGAGILRTLPAAEPEAIAEFRRRVEAIGHPWPEDMPYGEYLRRVDRADPAAPAIMQAASKLFRGADYVPFDGAPPADPVQAAIGAPYAHTTAPLRRLVDRFVLAMCTDAPAWARDALPELAEIMRQTGSLANRLEGGALDRIEAAELQAHLGSELDAVVVSETRGGSRVQIADPFVTATIRETRDPGSRIRVRVTGADIATGAVQLVVA
ncbi:RNB domain-containing ribonuclease [Microbacterium sp. MEC084]|uniref:RNB domain-containing ribonuclease n=1 Tax=unclassified Microbacterium TaxID=2609290 RepID=UPI0006F8FAE9|nr:MULTISPECIES: RNB domain-containing ribonuclease [unclassified Microbacterium]KQY97019.1 ribonuclease II [Microbacterium sp. Root53]MCD1268219.1 RNB domain-containing ribonuclease [Microbacterium sp. MEC084]